MDISFLIMLITGVLSFLSSLFFYLYGKEFFMHGAPLSWKIISTGLFLMGLGFLFDAFVINLLNSNVTLFFPTPIFIGALSVAVGFSIGLYNTSRGEF